MPHSTYLADRMGHAVIEPQGAFEAGSMQSFTLTYTAGFFGIDDTGSIKIAHRIVSDMGRPQFRDPKAAGFVSAEASNGAVLDVRYDDKQNIRPWDKTLYIKVVRGFLREGDRIVVRFGDRGGGSPGIRTQTFCEDSFEFKVLVDVFATYDYIELPHSPTIAIVPGPPVNWKAILPTLRRVGDTFRLCLKGEDAWGNPSNQCNLQATLRASHAVDGLPETVRFTPGEFATIVEGISVRQPGDLRIELLGPDGVDLGEFVPHPGDLRIELLGPDGNVLTCSNPMRIVGESPLLPYWGDLHGQSQETVGTNSPHDYICFARDRAFLDVCCHQGNDFQITKVFWRQLNDITREVNRDGMFIAFPGYEWSGNTGLGGDRNVLYLKENRGIYRSSHALLDDLSDIDTDANNIEALHERLKDEECLVFPHIGGRDSDITQSHDARLERSVEVHSAWGTFEWLVHDALEARLSCGNYREQRRPQGEIGRELSRRVHVRRLRRPDVHTRHGIDEGGNLRRAAAPAQLRHHGQPHFSRYVRHF